MLDDDVGALFEGDGFAEGRLYLARNVEGVEYRLLFLVELNDVGTFGGNECDLVQNLLVGVFVVDVYGLERG